MNVSISGADGKDSIGNTANVVNISGNGGDDYITNEGTDVFILSGAGNDSIQNIGSIVFIGGNNGDDYILNWAANVSIDSGAGNDEIYNEGTFVSLMGNAGNDVITNNGSTNTISGGAGDDVIGLTTNAHNNLIRYDLGEGVDNVTGFNDDDTLSILGDYSTQVSGNDVVVYVGQEGVILRNAASLSAVNIVSRNDGSATETPLNIRNTVANTLIAGTAYNDTVINTNAGANVTVQALGGNDSIVNHGASVSVDGGAGNDSLSNDGNNVTLTGGDGADNFFSTGEFVTIDAGNGNDSISNLAANVTIAGGDGFDSVWNTAANVSINVGAGDDSVLNSVGANVAINLGAGNDTIENSGANVTITGGTGDDNISLSSSATGNVINYTSGDGLDTIWGYSSNTTINISGDRYTTQYSGDDIVYLVGTGSITLKDARDKPLPIIIGESGSSGGSSGGEGGSGGNDGGGRGGNDGGNSSGGTSGNEGRGSDASGGNSASGSRGNTGGSSGGGYGSNKRNPFVLLEERQANNSTPTTSTPTTSNTSTTTSQTIYTGGNQVVSNYAGEPIIFGGEYTGAYVDDGTFYFGSTTGVLAIQNAADKIIDIRDAAGNAFIKGYVASSAGTIDGRNLSGFEVFNGSNGSDEIFAGNGGSQLWGGAGNVTDTLTGGNGVDIFIGGRNQGADNFRNASSADIVHFNDAALSDIAYTSDADGTIVVNFRNGNVVNVQSTDELSARFLLADGSEYRYDHANKTWQTNQRVYGGGNQVVSNYSGEPIIFGGEFAGAFVDGNNFNFLSKTGTLTIQNAADKIIDLRDVNGNEFIKGYFASSTGTIDGRNLAGFEVLNGSSGADEIFAGNGGSQLWGGAGNVTDVLTGGNGVDIFIGGQNQGADAFLNASSNDIVHLNDASLSDIVSAIEDNGTIAITFANGNDIAVQSTESISARFLLADGSTHQFNHSTKSW